MKATTQKHGSSKLIAAALSAAIGLPAIAGNNPVDEKWWPSEFGADDQAGATNYITPQKRVAGAVDHPHRTLAEALQDPETRDLAAARVVVRSFAIHS